MSPQRRHELGQVWRPRITDVAYICAWAASGSRADGGDAKVQLWMLAGEVLCYVGGKQRRGLPRGMTSGSHGAHLSASRGEGKRGAGGGVLGWAALAGWAEWAHWLG